MEDFFIWFDNLPVCIFPSFLIGVVVVISLGEIYQEIKNSSIDE